jgi:hypothetical protein
MSRSGSFSLVTAKTPKPAKKLNTDDTTAFLTREIRRLIARSPTGQSFVNIVPSGLR